MKNFLCFLSLILMVAVTSAGAAERPNIVLILAEDIAEANDLPASHPERVNALSDLLDEWEAETAKTGLRFEDVPRPNKNKK